MKETLSASKIKTLKSCSWQYWCKYHLKLPDKTNDGALKGWIVHLIFECLGNPRHLKHYKLITKKKDVLASKAVKRLIFKHIKASNLNFDDHLKDICEMVFKGLLYDFFGKEYGKPSRVIAEKDFEIEVSEGDINYKIKGFIDRLFIYDNKGFVLIRDFKTNKKKYEGEEVTDNLQDNMYTLAVSKLFPELKDIEMEFVFLKQPTQEQMIMKMHGKTKHELTGFEYELSEYQKYADNFNEETATSNMAVYQGMPRDGSFSGKLLCGFASRPNELKKDGSPKWHCSFKFGFDYYAVVDKNGKTKKSYFSREEIKDSALEATDRVEFRRYGGCPHFCSAKTEESDGFNLDIEDENTDDDFAW